MDNNTELILPALRVHMGDWIYYVTFLGMEQIADRMSLQRTFIQVQHLKC